MTEGERRRRSAHLHAESASLSAVLQPLSEMVTALSPEARLSIVTARGGALEVIASTGADALSPGTALPLSVVEGSRDRLAFDRSFTFTIDDTSLPENARDALLRFSMHAGFAAWLYSIDDTAEYVVVDEPGRRMDFGDRLRRLLDVAVAQARVSRENADLRLRATMRQRTLEAIARIGVAFSSVLDLKQTADQIVEYATLLLDLPASVLLFRPQGARDFEVLAAEGVPSDVSRFHVNPLDLASIDVQQPGSLGIGPLPSSGPGSLFEALIADGLSNVLAAPLVVGEDKLRGVLLALDSRKMEPDEEDREALNLLALQAANAIWNAERYEGEVTARREAKRELQTTGLLLEAANELNKWTDVDKLLNALAKIILRAVPHDRVNVGVIARDRSHVAFAASAGSEAVSSSTIVPWDQLSEGLREVLTEGRTKKVEPEEPATEDPGLADTVTTRVELLVPLVFHDRILGHVAIDDTGVRREYTDRQIEIVEGIAAQAAVAIENARLFESQRQELARTTVLREIAAQCARARELSDLGNGVLDVARRLLHASIGMVFRVDGAARLARPLAAFGFPQDSSVPIEDLPVDESTLGGRAILTGQPQISSGVDAPWRTAQRAQGTGSESSRFVTFPIEAYGKVVGMFGLGSTSESRFGEEELDLYKAIGELVGVAMENIRLFEAEREIADRLQEALLTLPDQLAGVDFAHAYHGATEAARVGGDFYDIFELNHNHIGITIGDVAGKGLDAAVLTSLVKNTIRAHANERGKTPAEVLTLTNDIVYKSTKPESFVTVFFAILDCRDGRLVYANAGHTTAAIVREDCASKLPTTGPILGAFVTVEFEQAEAWLPVDQILFLYTDGLTEARRHGKLYGEDRLFSFLSTQRSARPADIVGAVIDDVLSFGGEKLRDDLAIMAVRRLEPGAEIPIQQKLEM